MNPAPTLARLSFWLPPERMADFETAYRAQIVPILARHGLAESLERCRATVTGAFSRLFQVARPSDVARVQTALDEDPAWDGVLRALGAAFETSRKDGRIPHRLGLYATPLGSGKPVEVETRVTETQGVVRDPRDAQIDELERRVRERSAELETANAALSSANKELSRLNADLTAANEQIQEANRLKSQFLANMSHELRTPMNAIIGFTRIVLRRAGHMLPDRHRGNLEKVMLSADDLLALINEVLDLSKIEAGRLGIRPQPFDVKTLVQGCCATISPLVKPGVDLRCDVAEAVGEANTDGGRLRQIVINLLSNAAKFTESGEIRIRVSLEAGQLVMAVSDTGIGIPADALDAIFEEFRQVDGSATRKHHGTGLGLSITKKLTELLGGSVSVASDECKGSKFTVSIPADYSASKCP